MTKPELLRTAQFQLTQAQIATVHRFVASLRATGAGALEPVDVFGLACVGCAELWFYDLIPKETPLERVDVRQPELLAFQLVLELEEDLAVQAGILPPTHRASGSDPALFLTAWRGFQAWRAEVLDPALERLNHLPAGEHQAVTRGEVLAFIWLSFQRRSYLRADNRTSGRVASGHLEGVLDTDEGDKRLRRTWQSSSDAASREAALELVLDHSDGDYGIFFRTTDDRLILGSRAARDLLERRLEVKRTRARRRTPGGRPDGECQSSPQPDAGAPDSGAQQGRSLQLTGEGNPGRDFDPADEADLEAAVEAADAVRAVAEVTAARMEKERRGSATWHVLNKSTELLQGNTTLTAVAKEAGLSRSTVSEAWADVQRWIRRTLSA